MSSGFRPPYRASRSMKATQGGLTLIELVMTLSIASLLSTLAVPSFQDLVRANRIAALSNEFSAAIQFARSEAITRGTRVSLCSSANPEAATPSCSTGIGWAEGWIVFVDGGTPGALDGADQPLRLGQPAASDATIDGGTRFADFLSFEPTGISRGGDGLPNGHFEIQLDTKSRCIYLNATGRARIDRNACS